MRMGEKCESQVDELDKLKLKVVLSMTVLVKEVHMTQQVGFVVINSVSVT